MRPLQSIIQNAMLRWFGALSWTIMLVVVLLSPAKKTPAHELSLSVFLSTFFSWYSTRWDYIEASAHLVLFSILTAVWYLALSTKLLPRNALKFSIFISVFLAVVTELAQFFVHRGSLMLDLLVNVLAISIIAVWVNKNLATN